MFNNILLDQQRAAMKNVDGRSLITHNLFWGNGVEVIDCALGGGKVIRVDPQVDASYKPLNRQSCVDGGTVQVELPGCSGPIGPKSYSGPASDLGAHEIQ